MLEETLRRGLEEMHLACDNEILQRFRIYYDLLEERNRVMNLTAISGEDESATRHFLDSAAPLLRFPLAGRQVIDVGSGAGFPGLPLRILEPDVRMTLLDAQRKRVDFLAEVCAALGFDDVRCLHARAEELTAMREQYDYALARAVARLNLLAELCLPYVKVGGAFLALKGPGQIPGECGDCLLGLLIGTVMVGAAESGRQNGPRKRTADLPTAKPAAETAADSKRGFLFQPGIRPTRAEHALRTVEACAVKSDCLLFYGHITPPLMKNPLSQKGQRALFCGTTSGRSGLAVETSASAKALPRNIGRTRHSLLALAFGVPLRTVFNRLPLPSFTGRGALCTGCGRLTFVRHCVNMWDYTGSFISCQGQFFGTFPL